MIGALLVGSPRKVAFDEEATQTCRGMAQVLGVGLDNCRLAAAQQREWRLAVESQATLGTVLESVSNGICVVESDGTVRVANKAFLELFGMARAAGLSQDELYAAATN